MNRLLRCKKNIFLKYFQSISQITRIRTFLKCWIQIRLKTQRIRNPGKNTYKLYNQQRFPFSRVEHSRCQNGFLGSLAENWTQSCVSTGLNRSCSSGRRLCIFISRQRQKFSSSRLYITHRICPQLNFFYTYFFYTTQSLQCCYLQFCNSGRSVSCYGYNMAVYDRFFECPLLVHSVNANLRYTSVF